MCATGRRMINHQYKFVHVHCKKAGGMSLGHLFPQFETHHNNMHEYFMMLGSSLKDYFAWSIARNPWDRMVSLFYYENQVSKNCRTDDFKTFIVDMYDSVKSNTYEYYYDSVEQIDYMKDLHDQFSLDYVACLGNIERDFEMVKKRTGIPDYFKYPHANATKHGDYRGYYDEETKRMVAELQYKDIEFFGFVFEDNTVMRYPVEDCLAQPFQQAWRDRLDIDWPGK